MTIHTTFSQFYTDLRIGSGTLKLLLVDEVTPPILA